MTHRRSGCCVFLVLVFAGTLFPAQKPTPKTGPISFDVAPVPAWVKPITLTNAGAITPETTGMAFLLVDRQENIGLGAYHYHDIRKVMSESGVQDGASISASFNPSYEKLIFHTIRVIRNETSSNRLDRARFKVAPREENRERFLYTPVYTAELALDDLRVGDLIETAYTIEGVNPLRQGKYAELYPMQWATPTGRNFLRIVHPAGRKIIVEGRNDTTKSVVTTRDGNTEHVYEAANVPGRKIEENVPEDYDPRRRLQLSEFGTWDEPAQWARPLFEVKIPRSAEFEAEVTKLRAIADPEQRVVAALQFVQDAIRFVSVRAGPAVHLPTPCEEILQRRFADTKDKVVLLVSLLRASDIDAASALVSNSYRNSVRELLPSPRIFDHAIVEVRLRDNTYWIDPTRGLQRGPLRQVYVANYGQALVLRPETTALTAFRAPRESWSAKKVINQFRVTAPGNNAELEVVSDYRGLAADRARASFRQNTREEMQKQYLEYYARIYPETKAIKPPWYEEIPGENACRVTEYYVIPKIWTLSDDGGSYRLTLRPGEVYSALGSGANPQREDPLTRDYPHKIVEEIHVQMFEDWPFQEKGNKVSTKFFELREEPHAQGSHLQFNYLYESLRDRVEVSELAEFTKEVNKATESIGYTLTYRTPQQLKENRKNRGFNWAVAAAALSFLGTTSYIAWRYFRDRRLATPLPPPVDAPAHLNGIGGWLILVAIILHVDLIAWGTTGFTVFSSMMNLDSWLSLTDPTQAGYHFWWAPGLLFELFFNIACLAWLILLIALFFTKKAAWPRCFVVFLVVSFLGSALDAYISHRIPAAADSMFEEIAPLVGSALEAAIWIPYIYRSRRVKATFRY